MTKFISDKTNSKDTTAQLIVIKCHAATLQSEEYLRDFASSCYELSQYGAKIIIIHDIIPAALGILEESYHERMLAQKYRAFISASKIISALNDLNLHAVSIFASNSELIRAEFSQRNDPDLLLEDYIALPKEVNPEILFYLSESSNIISIISPIGLFEKTGRAVLLDSNITAAKICSAVDGSYLILQNDEEIKEELEEFIESGKIGLSFEQESLIKATSLALKSGSIKVRIPRYSDKLINSFI